VRRVAIVGTPGAGKSTLARELGARAGLPVIHLDQHAFLPGWQWKSDEEWDRIAPELLAGERWVMDGAFAMEEAVARADTIVFLDFSRARGYLGSVNGSRWPTSAGRHPTSRPAARTSSTGTSGGFSRLSTTIRASSGPTSWPTWSGAERKVSRSSSRAVGARCDGFWTLLYLLASKWPSPSSSSSA